VKNFSRAKAQRKPFRIAAALCAFAPLREKILFDLVEVDSGGGFGDVDGGDGFERR